MTMTMPRLTMTEPTIPADVLAEQACLGAVLLSREAIVEIAPWLLPGEFYLEKHAWIYEAMLDCFSRGVTPDARTVSDELRRHNRLEAAGGIPYLGDLVSACPAPSMVVHYAEIIQRTALNRSLIQAGMRITALGYDEGGTSEALVSHAYAELDHATQQPAKESDLVPLATSIDLLYEALSKAQEEGVPLELGILTGYRDLDELLGGLRKQDLLILAARPSVGKSSLALCLALGVARQQKRVDVFSLEMSREQLIQRLLSMESGIDHTRIRNMTLTERELQVAVEAMGQLGSLPMHIDETPGLNVSSIRNRVLRNAARFGPPALIVIDYLQLMQGHRYSDNRVQEVSQISKGLKGLAKELDVPVLALSQLSRAVEGRTTHVPMLSDLRESGSIEQDADIVAFIYREELYDKETERKGIAEIHVAKHRNGPCGVVPMRFDATTTRFLDLTYREPEGYESRPAVEHYNNA